MGSYEKYKRERKGKRIKEKKERKGKKKVLLSQDPVMTMTGVAILWWWEHTQLFAGVSFIVQSPPSVTPLENIYVTYSRRFMIFCTGTSGGSGRKGSLRWS